MKSLIPFVIISTIFTSIKCLAQMDSILRNLDEIIESKKYFIERKQEKIDELKNTFYSKKYELSNSELFNYYLQLTEQYETFKFDSAYHYGAELVKVSNQTKDPEKTAVAKIKLSNILISAGLFSPMLDTLKSIEISDLSNQSKALYYSALSRGYFDMESFSQRFGLP